MGEIAPLIMGQKYRSEMISKNVSAIFGNSDAKPAINGMRDMTRSLLFFVLNIIVSYAHREADLFEIAVLIVILH